MIRNLPVHIRGPKPTLFRFYRMNAQTMIIQHYFFGTTRNLLAGASLCYAIQNERYLETPLTIFFPSIYAGYHLYKNREHLAHWSKVLRD